jgi:cobalamin biosynthetic protein CobC
MKTEQRPIHGGDLSAARKAAPRWRGEWIDLSTGINPWPYPLPTLAEDVWRRLPDGDLVDPACAAARAHYGAPEGAVLVPAPGSQALIQWLPRLRPPGRVAICGPTYGEHAYSWRLAGHEVDIVADPLAAADVVVVTNPNNPDGRVLARDVLLDAAARLDRRGGWLVVDEAFADLQPDCSLASFADASGICVLRSLGKFFGLAGLRLGFAIAGAEIGDALRAALGPWAVGGPALATGAAALGDRAWIAATRGRLAAAAAELRGVLTQGGFTVVGGTDLFQLAAHDDAEAVFERLLQNGILVRNFADRPGLLRFGLPAGGAESERLKRALAD